MGTLQGMWESALHEQLQSDLFLKTLIRRKFASMGLALSEKQIAYAARRLKQARGPEATIRFNEKHLLNADAASTQAISGTRSVCLSEDDVQGAANEIGSWLQEFMEPISEKLAARVFAEVKRNSGKFLRETDRDRLKFQLRLAKTWRKAFHLLDLFLGLALQSGGDFNRQCGLSSTSANDAAVYVLTRLHARACQVSAETIALLKAGFADGAHARWRTLHEIAVVSTFIAKHGTETARRYLAHDAVESYKAARQYQDQCHAIGHKPLSREEMAKIQRRYTEALTRYDNSFKGSYGWAAFVLNKAAPTFRDIEHDVKLDNLSPYYKLASHNVHANPKGISFKLGLGPDRGKVLLAGPSNTGLLDPAQCTALSLLQTTSALLGIRPNLDGVVIMKVLIKLEREIALVFAATQRRIESMESATTAV
jgi:hypothetical protein